MRNRTTVFKTGKCSSFEACRKGLVVILLVQRKINWTAVQDEHLFKSSANASYCGLTLVQLIVSLDPVLSLDSSQLIADCTTVPKLVTNLCINCITYIKVRYKTSFFV